MPSRNRQIKVSEAHNPLYIDIGKLSRTCFEVPLGKPHVLSHEFGRPSCKSCDCVADEWEVVKPKKASIYKAGVPG